MTSRITNDVNRHRMPDQWTKLPLTAKNRNRTEGNSPLHRAWRYDVNRHRMPDQWTKLPPNSKKQEKEPKETAKNYKNICICQKKAVPLRGILGMYARSARISYAEK